jgi:kynureninase
MQPEIKRYEASAEFARSLDVQDELSPFREQFHILKADDGSDVIYFTGNSLGLQPKTAEAYVLQELRDWAQLGVEGHMKAANPWLPYHEFLTEKMAPIVGAQPIETVVMNSLTVNLHLLLISFYRPEGARQKIIVERGSFPSDRYAIVSHLALHGHNAGESLIELAPREGESALRTEDILTSIENAGDSLALVMLGGVNYYTGQAFDLAAITQAGHSAGAIVGFDLAHAAGNLELKLHDWQVDFAAWCSYKYLNGGPGAVGGAFVHERHSSRPELPRLAGWWGHEKTRRFLMGPDFIPIEGAEGWQVSNPPILQMAALRASLEIFDKAGMDALTRKSKVLTGYLEYLLGSMDDERISIVTPTDPQQRGCQLSIRVKGGDRGLHEMIVAKGISADWREPDVIRVAPVPLYNSFTDVYNFAVELKGVLATA